jgi:mannose-6-phosphate isomerase
MSIKLERRYVEKPWGRMQLPSMFDPPVGERIGEVWFTGDPSLPLLAKYIFTSERLSVQVHPDDAQARARGLQHGKSECWYILEAQPGATLGLGLKNELSKEQLRAAATDGSIERLMDWRSVSAGDFIFVPSCTIHAIGAGISLLEFQQNADVTYRLYDYGRPRALHLEDGVEVSRPEPFADELVQHLSGKEERTLVEGPHFILRLATSDTLQDRMRWVIPIEGEVRSGMECAIPGDCLLVQAGERLETSAARMLVGATLEQS